MRFSLVAGIFLVLGACVTDPNTYPPAPPGVDPDIENAHVKGESIAKAAERLDALKPAKTQETPQKPAGD